MDSEELKNEIERLKNERDALLAEQSHLYGEFPPGHYYSPIPSIAEIKEREREIFRIPSDGIPGVNLAEQRQLELLSAFESYYGEQPFEAHKKEGLRYFFENPSFSYADAIVLYSLIRHAKPSKIVEVGSGFSSCVMLDTSACFFDSQIACTFIDPHPELFLALVGDPQQENSEIIDSPLQAVDISIFSALSEGDILFIDSTHVSKVGSDVNRIFFEILPALKSGVFVHFHDIFYPFEYIKQWIYSGKAWNEAYLLRAFLQYNQQFQIQFFNSFMHYAHREKLGEAMPLCLKNPGGSIWLKKV